MAFRLPPDLLPGLLLAHQPHGLGQMISDWLLGLIWLRVLLRGCVDGAAQAAGAGFLGFIVRLRKRSETVYDNVICC
jgi:hypothetical protein